MSDTLQSKAPAEGPGSVPAERGSQGERGAVRAGRLVTDALSLLTDSIFGDTFLAWGEPVAPAPW